MLRGCGKPIYLPAMSSRLESKMVSLSGRESERETVTFAPPAKEDFCPFVRRCHFFPLFPTLVSWLPCIDSFFYTFHLPSIHSHHYLGKTSSKTRDPTFANPRCMLITLPLCSWWVCYFLIVGNLSHSRFVASVLRFMVRFFWFEVSRFGGAPWSGLGNLVVLYEPSVC